MNGVGIGDSSVLVGPRVRTRAGFRRGGLVFARRGGGVGTFLRLPSLHVVIDSGRAVGPGFCADLCFDRGEGRLGGGVERDPVRLVLCQMPGRRSAAL